MSPKSLIAFLLFPLCFLQAIPKVAGPITGDVRANEATLWMYAPAKSEGSVSYRPEGTSKADNKNSKLKALSDQAAKVPGQIFKSNHRWSVTRYPLPVSGFHRWKG
jgi:hypothetical protein